MKNLLYTVLVSILFSGTTFSQTEVASKISNVTVFQRNAQITRNLSFTSNKGTQEIVLTGISTQITPSSLQVQFNNSNSILLSAKYENNYLTTNTVNENVENLKNQLDGLNDKLMSLDDKKNILKGVEDILNKNQDLGGTNSSFTPQQVIELSNAYETKYTETKKALRAIAKKEKMLKEDIAKINKQLREVNAKIDRPSGNIILKVASKSVKPVSVECKYIVNNVGWTPIYDIRSQGITKNVTLNYKANIYQNTGVDWENVSVKISTGNPSQNNNRPILGPLYANIYQEQYIKNLEKQRKKLVLETTNMAMRDMKRASMEEVEMVEDEIQMPIATVSENQLSVDFDVLNKQTINSDGKENLMALKSYDLTTEYIYHSVPKLNKGAFWGKYNLMAGNANIFFEGGFVGNSYINPQVTSDSLLISMGMDNSIVVQRLPITEFTSSKSIGTNKNEIIGYDLIVKNKKSTPIKIEILDQIPVSQNKDIQVVLDEKGSAEYMSKIGKLLWTLDIEAGQSKKEKFIYSVKYPKKGIVSGIK